MTRGGKRDGAGRPAIVEGEKAKPFSVKLPPSEADLIRAAADELGLSQARLIVEAVRFYLMNGPSRPI